MIGRTALVALLATPLARAGWVDYLPSSIWSVQDQPRAVLNLARSPSPPVTHTLPSGNRTRTYGLVVPPDYDASRSWPLIVDFHGRHGSPSGQWNNSQYFRDPRGREYLVAYPLGCLGKGNGPDGAPETAWQGAPYANTSCNDTAFTADLVRTIRGTYNINSSRIYASGKSNGGGFVDTLACSSTGDLFAAFAMASAALYTDNLTLPDPCVGRRPRRILEAHGAADHTIPINGSSKHPNATTPDIGKWISRWATRNGCDAVTDRKVVHPPPTWGMNTTYACHGSSAFLQQYNVTGLGHCWPSLVNNTDSRNKHSPCLIHTLDFTSAVMDFFEMAQ